MVNSSRIAKQIFDTISINKKRVIEIKKKVHEKKQNNKIWIVTEKKILMG